MKGKYYVTLAILCVISNIFAQDPRVKAVKGILVDFCKEETGATTCKCLFLNYKKYGLVYKLD